MPYTVLTTSAMRELTSEGPPNPTHADLLATALTAMEERGFTFVAIDAPPHGEACYIFSGGATDRRLNNIR